MRPSLHRLRTTQAVVILALAAGCARTPRQAAPATAAVVDSMPNPALPPDADLSGGWMTGSVNEPGAPRVELHPGCTVNPAVWLVEQRGNALRAWAFPETYNQGIKRANDPISRVTPAAGYISGADVVLNDGTYRYVLRYDRDSGHLRGTRNGEPFWAVRQVVVRDGPCLPPPA